MPADRYGLPLSSASAVACDAYVQGCDLLLTLYPGAIEAFDRAIAADPGFALAHAGKAQVLMREGNVVAARASMKDKMIVVILCDGGERYVTTPLFQELITDRRRPAKK